MSFLARDPEMQRLLGLRRDQAAEPVRGDVLPARTGNPMASANGAYEGASHIERELALWRPNLNSVDGDIIPDKPTIDARTRDMLRNDSYVASGANIHKDNIVGAAFLLNSKPNHKVLGLDEKWAEEFQEEVESKFTLWAESINHWPDASRKGTLTDLVRLAVGVHLMSGEVLAAAEWIRESARPYRTAIQMVDLDRLSTPAGKIESRFLRAGIEKNIHGAPIAYHVRKAHPHEWLDADSYQWKRIDAYKPWGRVQMIHIFESIRPEQTRGVAEMASALTETKIARTFRKVALQRAIVDATYAASIESELPTEVIFQALGAGNMNAEEVAKVVESYSTGYLNTVNTYSGVKGHKIDGVKIPVFLPGTKLNVRPAGHGGPLGTEFEQSLLRYIAANLGISYEQLSRDYSKTNYSSAKAAMAETWKFMQSRKKAIADRFASHVFMLWLEEAFSKGHIDSLPRNAPNFWEGLNRDAYASCEWIGASRGQIDELKETQAAVLRIKYHLTTYEDELARLGKDWRRVFAQREREQEIMESRGLTVDPQDNMMNAASGAPRESEAKDEKDDGSEDNADARATELNGSVDKLFFDAVHEEEILNA